MTELVALAAMISLPTLALIHCIRARRRAELLACRVDRTPLAKPR